MYAIRSYYDFQQRPRHPAVLEVAQHRDAGQALDAAAAHQVQEQRFRQVLGVMRRQIHLLGAKQACDHAVATVARRLFGADAPGIIDFEPLGLVGDAAFGAERTAMLEPSYNFV